MDYKSSTLEEIEALYDKAEMIYNSPENFYADEMDLVLSQIDDLLKSYHESEFGSNVTWLSHASSP